MRRLVGGPLTAMALWLSVAAAAQAATPVAGYAERVVASGLQGAVGMDFAPDGRLFVVEKRGVLKVVRPGGAVRTVLDISGHVNAEIDRGLTGVAVDAAFAANRYVYLLYTYEGTGSNRSGPKTTRLTRIQVNPDDTVANPLSPERVILGSYTPTALTEACPAPSNTSDCIPADGISHVGGTVRAAPDGTLFVGNGDALLGAPNAPDPYRPLDPASYAGKILHISRDGRGLPGHPYCPTVTDLSWVCTKVFAMGFRNPFRFDFATRGGLWAGDVGESTTEELDLVVPGASYGWPCYEGRDRFAPRASSAKCQAAYGREGTSTAEVGPVYSYGHDGQGAAIIGGPEYRGDAYPADVRGSVFFGDINNGVLKRLPFDPDGKPLAPLPFATGYMGVDMRVGPDGLLYTANFFDITRFEPVAGNRAPVARASAAPTAGAAPLTVTFDGTGSADPDGDPLTYAWDFGDGTPPSTVPSPSHTYTTAGDFTARLTVTDASGQASAATVGIRSGVEPPSLAISGPDTYRGGEPVRLTATARDDDGRDLSASVRWQIDLRHNEHVHRVDEPTGASATFTPLRDHDTDSHHQVTAAVTDALGLTSTRTVRLDGETAPVSLAVDPPGASGSVAFGSVTAPWPVLRRSVIGYRTIVAASATVTSDGRTLDFAGWSNGGEAAHEVTVPPAGLALVARYAPDTTPPETTIVTPQAVYASANVQFRFTTEPEATFQCRVDNDVFFTCVSPYTTRKLPNGNHSFSVRAIDRAGNVDPTPAIHTFSVQAVG